MLINLLFFSFTLATNVGDEGGFAPNIQDNKEGKIVACEKIFETLIYLNTTSVLVSKTLVIYGLGGVHA